MKPVNRVVVGLDRNPQAITQPGNSLSIVEDHRAQRPRRDPHIRAENIGEGHDVVREWKRIWHALANDMPRFIIGDDDREIITRDADASAVDFEFDDHAGTMEAFS